MTELALALIALALALRVLVAPGFMPVMGAAGGISVTLCTGDGPVQIRLPGKAPAPAQQAHDPCPYGALAVPPLAPDAPVAVAAVMPPSAPAPLARPSADRPHLGAPAPPPPSTGPPLLA